VSHRRRWARSALAVLALGCGRAPDPGPAHRYAALAGHADPEGCAALADAALAAECRAFAAWELARRGDEHGAEATCASLPAGTWRDECFFQLADVIAATGERARALCAQAGGYEGHCIGHGIGRESQAILASSEIGDEEAAFAAVLDVATAWVGPRRGRSRADGILRKSLAARFPEGSDFDVTRCGAAPEHLCRDAYVQLVVERSGLDGEASTGVHAGRIGAVCSGPLGRDAVVAQGLPGWTDASAALVADAWERLCADGRGPGGPLAPGRAPRAPGAAPAPPRRRRRRHRLPGRGSGGGRRRARREPVLGAVAALLLSACSTPTSDADRYLAAAADPAADCAAIDDLDLRSECRVFAAADAARAGDLPLAEERCAAIDEGPWRDECWFSLADVTRARGTALEELCAHAGRFELNCLSHAVNRECREVLDGSEPGQEARALAEMVERARKILGDVKGPVRARKNLVKALAARFERAPFDPAGCGTAPETVCVQVYRELLILARDGERPPGVPPGRAAVDEVCREGVDLDRVVALGLPAWTDAGAPLAATAWRAMCDQGDSHGKRPPRGGGAHRPRRR